MSTTNDQLKAMRFEYPDCIPVSVSILPATWKKYRNDLKEVVDRHPPIFG